jgi:hypothetical protein
MNRKVLFLNLALLGLIGLLVWQLRLRRQAAEAHERAVLLKDGQGRTLLAPPSPAPVPPVVPAEYNDSVQRMLFSKDRNPNVIVDPPPPAPPPKPVPAPPTMPPLPRYYGQFHFGGPPVVILSSAAANDQKQYEVGKKIGDFTILAFDQDSVTFEWDGKPVVKKLAELEAKDAQQPGQPGQAGQPGQQYATPPSPPPPAQANPFASVVTLGGESKDANAPPAVVGNDMGGGFYNCRSDDRSPSGTVVNGYKKTSAQGLMGATCRWEKVQ